MRIFSSALLATGVIFAVAPARAQTYDPTYPVCLQTYGIDGGYIECSFTSLAQCAATASGRSAQCLTNPYFGQGASFARGARKLPRQRDSF